MAQYVRLDLAFGLEIGGESSQCPQWQRFRNFPRAQIPLLFWSIFLRICKGHVSCWDVTGCSPSYIYSNCNVPFIKVQHTTGLSCLGHTKRNNDSQKYQRHVLKTGPKNTHKLTCESCTHRNSVTEHWVSAASCLLNHIQKKISSSV